MRISIRKHNQQFIKDYARQVGMNEVNALDYLLSSLRLNGINMQPQKLDYVTEDQLLNEYPQADDYRHANPEEFAPTDLDPVVQKFVTLLEDF